MIRGYVNCTKCMGQGIEPAPPPDHPGWFEARYKKYAGCEWEAVKVFLSDADKQGTDAFRVLVAGHDKEYRVEEFLWDKELEV